MLPHAGRPRPANLSRRTRKSGKDILHSHWTKLRVLHSGDRVTRLEMRIVENVGDTIDRRTSAFVFIEFLQRCFRRVLANPTADNPVYFFDIGDTSAIIFEARIIY